MLIHVIQDDIDKANRIRNGPGPSPALVRYCPVFLAIERSGYPVSYVGVAMAFVGDVEYPLSKRTIRQIARWDKTWRMSPFNFRFGVPA